MSDQEELTDKQKLAEKEAELSKLKQEIHAERQRIREEERAKVEKELKEKKEAEEKSEEEVEKEEENRLYNDEERLKNFVKKRNGRIKRFLEELGIEAEETSLAEDREKFQEFVKKHKTRIKETLLSKEEKDAEKKEWEEKAPSIVANDNQILKKFVSDYKDRVKKILQDLEEAEKEEVIYASRKSSVTGEAGEKFFVEAMPASPGQVFKCWKVSIGDATIANKNSETTSITLKEKNTIVVATYSVDPNASDSKLRLKVGSGYVETEEEKKAREELEKSKESS